MPPTLVVSTWSLPATPALALAARVRGWRAFAADELRGRPREPVLYSGTDRIRALAERLGVALVEPPFDLLARLPWPLRRRDVELARLGDLSRLRRAFVKPADAFAKTFDAGLHEARDLPAGLDPRTPVLVAEPVEWLAEYRCFVRERRLVAWSPYLSFGQPSWKPYARGTLPEVPPNVRAFCDRVFAEKGLALPPAFVMDVGLIEDRGWAVVELNPASCSGVLGADPRGVIDVLARASVPKNDLTAADRRWVLRREP